MDSWKKNKRLNEDESPNKEMEIFQPAILVFKVFMYLMFFFSLDFWTLKECKLKKAAQKCWWFSSWSPCWHLVGVLLKSGIQLLHASKMSSSVKVKPRRQFGVAMFLVGGWTNPSEKYARQNGNLPQIGMKIQNVWNHHLGFFCLRKLWDSKKSLLPSLKLNMFAPIEMVMKPIGIPRNSRGLFSGDMLVSGTVNSNEILLMEEIRPSPVAVGSLSHSRQGFLHPRWCRIPSINSILGLQHVFLHRSVSVFCC